MKTVPERFIEIYENQLSVSRSNQDAFYSTCQIWQDTYRMKPPYSSNESFKVAYSRSIRCKK